jgi:hypothetical protein
MQEQVLPATATRDDGSVANDSAPLLSSRLLWMAGALFLFAGAWVNRALKPGTEFAFACAVGIPTVLMLILSFLRAFKHRAAHDEDVVHKGVNTQYYRIVYGSLFCQMVLINSPLVTGHPNTERDVLLGAAPSALILGTLLVGLALLSPQALLSRRTPFPVKLFLLGMLVFVPTFASSTFQIASSLLDIVELDQRAAARADGSFQ